MEPSIHHPFDPSYFAVKVHPSGALLFTPHHLQLTLLQHLIIQSPFLKQPIQFLADLPKYWLESDGTMCLHDSHRWKAKETIAWRADAVAKRYRPWPKGRRADSLPWFDSPLVQGASRLRYTDKAQMQRPGHTGRKALAKKKKETIAWLRKHGLHSVPNSIKADIGDLVYNGPKKTALDETSNFAPPSGRFVYFTGSRASNDPPPGL